MARKEKTRLNGMRKCMRVLGWFHYLQGGFRLLMAVLLAFTDPAKLGMSIKNALPSPLSFLLPLDDGTLGVLALAALFIGAASEFVIGRIWCRKARSTVRQTLAVVLSVIKTIRALYAILCGTVLTSLWSNIHSLILNAVTLTLALWMHGEYRKQLRAAEDM